VLRDVRNELLSPQKAEADYGVVIDVKTWRVDDTATKKRRDAIRAARGWRDVPKVQWRDPIAPRHAVG
jgi:N-methylhydantoinase B